MPTLEEALEATGDGRVMVDLPGAADARAVRRIVGVIRDCGAEERVYYCAGADDDARGARGRPRRGDRADLDDARARRGPRCSTRCGPRWLNYRFALVNRDLTARVHRDGYLLVSAWTPDTRRSMRRLLDVGRRLDHDEPHRHAVRPARQLTARPAAP